MMERELTKFEEDVARKAIKATCEIVSDKYITKEKAKEFLKEQLEDFIKISDDSIDKAARFGLFVGVIATSAIWLVMMWIFN